MKCSICKQNPREYLWQPAGPADNFDLFMFPGWHYRGFPAIGCCDLCRKRIQENQERVDFTFKKKPLYFHHGKIYSTQQETASP